MAPGSEFFALCSSTEYKHSTLSRKLQNLTQPITHVISRQSVMQYDRSILRNVMGKEVRSSVLLDQNFFRCQKFSSDVHQNNSEAVALWSHNSKKKLRTAREKMKCCAAYIYLNCLISQRQIGSVASFQSSAGRKRSFAHRHQNLERPTNVNQVTTLYQSFNNEDLVTTRRVREQPSSLKAFTVDAFDVECDDSGKDLLRIPTMPSDFAGIQAVITTALMVTGNTIGAGALVLPEIAAKPGMAISAGLFVGEWFSLRCPTFRI